MKNIKFIFSLLLILTSFVLCQQILSTSIANQQNKKDAAEINDIRYGLLSIDVWKQQISQILADEIDKLSIEDMNEQELKAHIESQLTNLIDKVNKKIEASNRGSAKGWFKQAFIDLFVSVDDIKKGIPEYANGILASVKKSKTQAELKGLLKKKLEEYLSQTFDTQDKTTLTRIMLETNSPDIKTARVKLDLMISAKKQIVNYCAIALIIVSIILFSLPAFHKNSLSTSEYFMMVISLILLIVVGVATPMIDMEAKIAKMSFVFLDHTVNFDNQVLYFQTKSILDVFWIMITDKTIQMKFVGILVVTFSIFIPLFKVLSMMIYYYDYRQLKKNKLIEFFVLKAGKWSMADVMVVAIFMAYIGFNGIISSQLGKMNTATADLVTLTTNGTALQAGYFIFLTYVILSLVLSSYLTRNPDHKVS